jgi:hypothetical protein
VISWDPGIDAVFHHNVLTSGLTLPELNTNLLLLETKGNENQYIHFKNKASEIKIPWKGGSFLLCEEEIRRIPDEFTWIVY